MPEDILKAELYPIFGGYWGYQEAPVEEIVRQRLVLIARHTVEARQNAEVEAKLAEQEREASMTRGRR